MFQNWRVVALPGDLLSKTYCLLAWCKSLILNNVVTLYFGLTLAEQDSVVPRLRLSCWLLDSVNLDWANVFSRTKEQSSNYDMVVTFCVTQTAKCVVFLANETFFSCEKQLHNRYHYTQDWGGKLQHDITASFQQNNVMILLVLLASYL